MTHKRLWGNGLGDLAIINLVMLFWVGKHIYIMSCLYMLCIAHLFYVCGDDRITCYPGADDVTGGPGDT